MTDIHFNSAFEQVIGRIYDDIDDYGYAVFDLPATDDRPPWAYTIGLIDECGHPEVSVIGESFARAEALLDSIADGVLNGLEIPLDEDVVFDEIVYHVKPVETPVLHGGLFAAWRAYYDYLRDPPLPPLSALELCRCGVQPNRAERRARRRHLRLAR